MSNVKKVLKEHLQTLSIKLHPKLVVHSNLVSLGLKGDICQELFNAFFEIGVETLAVPTYTFSVSETQIYSRNTTPSTNVGVFSEYVRKQPNAFRSFCPIHNHAFIGKGAEYLSTAADKTMSLGENSDFSILKEQGFSLLLLGTNYQRGCTYLHHMEALWGVPYRHYVKSKKMVLDETTNDSKIIDINYFARNEMKVKSNLSAVNSIKELAKASTVSGTMYGDSTLISLENLDKIVGKVLEKDPYFLVEKE